MALTLTKPKAKTYSKRAALTKCRDWVMDAFTPPMEEVPQPAYLEPGHEDFKRMAFTFAVIALHVKLAKLGGHVSREEYLAFRDLFPHENAESPKIRRLFTSAWEDMATHDVFARRIVSLYPKRKPLYTEILQKLCVIAAADGRINKHELQFIRTCADIFGLTRREAGRLFDDYCEGAPFNPYNILGISVSATEVEIKAAYRTLMWRYHPDRVMGSQALPEDVALAVLKAAAVNRAYHNLTRK